MNHHGPYCVCLNCNMIPGTQRVKWSPIGEAAIWRSGNRYPAMTASDLGIVDQLLDDKVGMEP